MKYLKTTYKTITGKADVIDIGDYTYGEWIIYENEKPRFHINCFRENSESDILIKNRIENQNQSIEFIINEINSKLKKKLTLGKRPTIEIKIKSELIEMVLHPLPIEWLINK